MVLIERKIPEDYTLCPVARGADDQLHLLLKKLPFLPFAAGTLGQPNVFVRETLVQLIL